MDRVYYYINITRLIINGLNQLIFYRSIIVLQADFLSKQLLLYYKIILLSPLIVIIIIIIIYLKRKILVAKSLKSLKQV